jgi:serine/threonine protein kinase
MELSLPQRLKTFCGKLNIFLLRYFMLTFTAGDALPSILNHPSILTVHEIGQEGGNHFIITEFVDGQTLRQRMKDARISPTEALDVVIQVTSALRAAHAAGIIHRDIKPENVMVRADGLVKDFEIDLKRLRQETGSSSGQDDFKQPSAGKAVGASAVSGIRNVRVSPAVTPRMQRPTNFICKGERT